MPYVGPHVVLRGVVFDLDGVLTDTATLHERAWSQLAQETLAGHRLTHQEYLQLIDGRQREDGVVALLNAHHVLVAPDRVHELAATKDGYFQDLLSTRGPGVFRESFDLVRRLRAAGRRLAVVTASRTGRRIVALAGLADLFDVVVDGDTALELALPGKPDPAAFLEAAHRLALPPHRVVVVEDSRAGIVAATRGGFGLVIGVDRPGSGEELATAGADVVVADLAAVTVEEDDG